MPREPIKSDHWWTQSDSAARGSSDAGRLGDSVSARRLAAKSSTYAIKAEVAGDGGDQAVVKRRSDGVVLGDIIDLTGFREVAYLDGRGNRQVAHLADVDVVTDRVP